MRVNHVRNLLDINYMMKATESTILQIKRFFNKVSQKFPNTDEPDIMTDIHLSVSQETGELLAFDDNDNEITRCVVDQWINSKEQDFYMCVAGILRDVLKQMGDILDSLCILKPYSFILENDDREHFAELYLVDSDIRIIGGDLMNNLDDDLNKFLDILLKE